MCCCCSTHASSIKTTTLTYPRPLGCLRNIPQCKCFTLDHLELKRGRGGSYFGLGSTWFLFSTFVCLWRQDRKKIYLILLLLLPCMCHRPILCTGHILSILLRFSVHYLCWSVQITLVVHIYIFCIFVLPDFNHQQPCC